MRTTVTIDDELMKAAQEYSGLTDRAAIIRLALVEYLQREAARRLAALGGSQPDFEVPRRRRLDD
jgi:Arc/MetJ family transcription regulator